MGDEIGETATQIGTNGVMLGGEAFDIVDLGRRDRIGRADARIEAVDERRKASC